MITGETLRLIAAKLLNLDFDTLADAGVLKRARSGQPAVGGSDWRMLHDDPLMFLVKLPADRREKLARLISPETPISKVGVDTPPLP